MEIRGKLAFLFSLTVFIQHAFAVTGTYRSNQSMYPITIIADTLIIDGKKHQSVYKGNVTISQNTTQLKGNEVTVLTDESHKVKQIVSLGNSQKPAYYEEKDKDGVIVHAWGEKIYYNLITQKLALTRQAKLERNGNLFTSQYIEYEQKTQKIYASSNIGTKDSNSSESERVKISITPE